MRDTRHDGGSHEFEVCAVGMRGRMRERMRERNQARGRSRMRRERGS